MSLSRASAIAIALICGMTLAFVLPNQVEPYNYGLIKPVSLPFAALAVMTVSALAAAFESGSGLRADAEFLVKTGLTIVLSVLALIGLKHVGFEYTMPVFALLIMLLTGERQWGWLIAGTAIPLALWFLSETVLGRPLP
ncbi:tripartite tricarboxylate transporter TctB family protein [Phaeobacter sp. SYSU ZJ3003]|uniref:tripartite tricarboxylate transporter TctB family protein n=1 Tax=Phaeobacter sp. SYSU ZJ3003 TaxID=2109330 RepID=UPI00351C6395